MHFANQRPIMRTDPVETFMQMVTSIHWEYVAVFEDEGKAHKGQKATMAW